MSTAPHTACQSGVPASTVRRPGPADVAAVSRLLRRGRVVIGRPVNPAALEVAVRSQPPRTFPALIYFRGCEAPTGLILYEVSGRTLPTAKLCLVVDPQLTGAGLTMAVRIATETIVSFLDLTYGRGGAICDVRDVNVAVPDALTAAGWTAVETVIDGYRRYIRMMTRTEDGDDTETPGPG